MLLKNEEALPGLCQARLLFLMQSDCALPYILWGVAVMSACVARGVISNLHTLPFPRKSLELFLRLSHESLVFLAFRIERAVVKGCLYG